MADNLQNDDLNKDELSNEKAAGQAQEEVLMFTLGAMEYLVALDRTRELKNITDETAAEVLQITAKAQMPQWREGTTAPEEDSPLYPHYINGANILHNWITTNYQSKYDQVPVDQKLNWLIINGQREHFSQEGPIAHSNLDGVRQGYDEFDDTALHLWGFVDKDEVVSYINRFSEFFSHPNFVAERARRVNFAAQKYAKSPSIPPAMVQMIADREGGTFEAEVSMFLLFNRLFPEGKRREVALRQIGIDPTVTSVHLDQIDLALDHTAVVDDIIQVINSGFRSFSSST